jgi:putative FmdB family regulatory protein
LAGPERHIGFSSVEEAMPTYEFKCSVCSHRFEKFLAITDNSKIKCPVCEGEARRLISGGGGLLFKGSGFYETDYKKAEYMKKAKKEEE